MTGTADPALVARRALEQVCARGDIDAAKELYSDAFVDHVNGRIFRGPEGIRHSVALYQRLLHDFSITVHDQIADGDRVASRFSFSGHRGGRRVEASGITISRFSEGRIVEDWTITDSASLARQLGIRGAIAVAFTWLRSSRPAPR